MRKLPLSMMILSFGLSGCAMQQGDFPSLQKRAYEEQPAVVDTGSPPAVVAALPEAVQTRLDAAVQQSAAAHDQFQAALADVSKRVDAARNAAVSSEAWVVAQMELAALEIQRSPSVEALADIDSLFIEQLESETAANSTGGAAIIASRRSVVRAQVDSQQVQIEAMKNRLR